MPVSFDSFTKNYNEVVDEAIHGTGYDTEGLVAAKLQKIANLFPSLPKNKFNLLDFGCGVGNLYGHVAHFFPKAIYTGVDLSKSSIKKLVQDSKNMKLFKNMIQLNGSYANTILYSLLGSSIISPILTIQRLSKSFPAF